MVDYPSGKSNKVYCEDCGNRAYVRPLQPVCELGEKLYPYLQTVLGLKEKNPVAAALEARELEAAIMGTLRDTAALRSLREQGVLPNVYR